MQNKEWTTNRTILELKFKIAKRCLTNDSNYQSHHTGIEMGKCSSLKVRPTTTNRTILELKSDIGALPGAMQRYQSHHTGIEIKHSCLLLRLYHPTNRTILELKYESGALQPLGIQLPIAPYWNWNQAGQLTGWLLITLPIAPYWNWNLVRTPLAPAVSSTNRTILELKWQNKQYMCNLHSYQSHHTGIEIGWWNGKYRS